MKGAQNAAARIAAGTGALLRTFGGWLVGEGWRDLCRRLMGTAATALFAGMLVYGTRWLMWPGVAWFLFAAWRAAAPSAEDEEPEGEPEEETTEDGKEPGSGQEQSEAAAQQVPAGPPLPNLPDLRIALARVGTPHAHLAVLAAAIGTAPERVREALERWEIPIEAVRMRGRGTSTGVKGGPVVHPSLALRPEDAAVVAAGQPANSNDNNTGFVTVPDAVNPRRTHVRWTK